MGKIFIENLQVHTVIGVYEFEKKIKQALFFTITMGCNLTLAAETDRLCNTLDYAAISNYVTQWVAEHQFELIETLAEKVAQQILVTFKPEWVKIKLCKPGAVKNADTVGIIITRYK